MRKNDHFDIFTKQKILMIYNFKARIDAATNVTNEIVNPEALLQSSVEHNEH